MIVIRFLIRVVVFLVSAALGLLITSLLIDGFQVNATGFVVSVLMFAVLQSVLSQFLRRSRTATPGPLLSRVGLISTFVALVVAHFFTTRAPGQRTHELAHETVRLLHF